MWSASINQINSWKYSWIIQSGLKEIYSWVCSLTIDSAWDFWMTRALNFGTLFYWCWFLRVCFKADPIHKEKVLMKGQENMHLFLLVPKVFDLHLVFPQPVCLLKWQGVLMWACMRCFSLVSVSPVVDDRQLSICVEKQRVAPSGKQSIVMLKSSDNKKF